MKKYFEKYNLAETRDTSGHQGDLGQKDTLMLIQGALSSCLLLEKDFVSLVHQ